jgi:hypothetical protein
MASMAVRTSAGRTRTLEARLARTSSGNGSTARDADDFEEF